jgi:hypothetical protein
LKEGEGQLPRWQDDNELRLAHDREDSGATRPGASDISAVRARVHQDDELAPIPLEV